MTLMSWWLLPSFGLILVLLQFAFTLRKFPKSLALRNLAFHSAFALLIGVELWALARLSFWPSTSLLSIRTAFPLLNALICFLALDLLSYGWHRLNHNVSWLWHFHLFHHRAETLDPIAAYRFHPVEVFLGYQLRALVMWGLGFTPESVSLFIIIYGAFNLYQHSNLKLPYLFEEIIALLFVTPTRHHVHHLREEKYRNSNYSTVFIFWDRLFGTYQAPIPERSFDIGVD